MKIYNVLIFPGGTEIGLEIHKSLSSCRDIRLYSAGLDISNHAPYVFARHYTLPSIYSSGWLERLNHILLECEIDYIFPALDEVMMALVHNAASIQARIITSPLETCVLTRSKSRTIEFFASLLPVPERYYALSDIQDFPVFVKPDQGYASQNTHIVYDKDHLEWLLLKEEKDYIVQEYLPGDEYTVDCFSDREAGLVFCSGRQRVRMKSGIAMNSKTVEDRAFTEYAAIISRELCFHGAWFFQVKKDAVGICKLLEIAPRIAGTMALHRVLGVNLPLLSLYEQERIPITIHPQPMRAELDRALINRYKTNLTYSTVYVDLDDTLILNHLINIPLITFLYQCLNKNISLVLLTKHQQDVQRTLKKYRLDGIFDRIVHLARQDDKSDYIKEDDAILIDDSFSERKGVSDKRGILTFDCSMIESLLDERG